MSEMANVNYHDYIHSKAWENKVAERMKIDKGTCQMCGSRGSPINPLECHHLTYKRLGDEDVWTDCVIVCDCCHQLITRLMNRVTSPDGRRGWSYNKTIPQVTVVTANGELQKYRKENLEV